MNCCQGILRLELQASPTGYPMTIVVHCRQTVGITSWEGSLGQTLRACSRHFGQVVAADRRALNAERVRHEMQPEPLANWKGVTR